jgi:hypothetical protein
LIRKRRQKTPDGKDFLFSLKSTSRKYVAGLSFADFTPLTSVEKEARQILAMKFIHTSPENFPGAKRIGGTDLALNRLLTSDGHEAK